MRETERTKSIARLESDQLNLLIGMVVKRARKLSKVNQSDLAGHLGLEQSALSRVETGRQQLTAAQWAILHKRKILPPNAMEEVLAWTEHPPGSEEPKKKRKRK